MSTRVTIWARTPLHIIDWWNNTVGLSRVCNGRVVQTKPFEITTAVLHYMLLHDGEKLKRPLNGFWSSVLMSTREGRWRPDVVRRW